MRTDEYADALRHWFRNGPREADGTLGYIVGSMLWWRLQAIAFLTVVPLIAGAVVYTQIGAGWAILAAATVGLFAGEKSMEVSPKYNVTENY